MNLKPVPFTIAIDNREQQPYSFGLATVEPLGYSSVRTITTYLPTGDYSIVGLEGRFAVERKSLEDLYATLGQGRSRFEAEFQRLNAMDFAAIVIEADLRDVWRPADARPGWKSRLRP